MVGVEGYTERSEDNEEKKRVRVKEEREEQEGKIDKEGGSEMVGDPFPLEMGVFGAHSISGGGDGTEEMAEEREEGVGGGGWDAVGGERGAAVGLDGGEGLDPEEEGGGPTGEFVRERVSGVGEGPGDGLDGLHYGDGRTEEEEGGVQLLVDADEDGEGAEGEGLEGDGGVPAHVIGGGRFVFWGGGVFLRIE